MESVIESNVWKWDVRRWSSEVSNLGTLMSFVKHGSFRRVCMMMGRGGSDEVGCSLSLGRRVGAGDPVFWVGEGWGLW